MRSPNRRSHSSMRWELVLSPYTRGLRTNDHLVELAFRQAARLLHLVCGLVRWVRAAEPAHSPLALRALESRPPPCMPRDLLRSPDSKRTPAPVVGRVGRDLGPGNYPLVKQNHQATAREQRSHLDGIQQAAEPRHCERRAQLL